MKTLPTHLDRLQAALGKQGVALKRHQLLEVCAAAFGYRNSNECTAAAKRGALDPAKAKRLGDARFDGIELAVVLDPIANAPYAIEAKHLGEAFAVTPFGNLVDLRDAAVATTPPLRGHWEDHPQYPHDDWTYEVANGDTRLSYSEWVEACIERDAGDDEPEAQAGQASDTTQDAWDGSGDHPVYGSAEWRIDADNGDTHLSYADWVKERLQEDAERAAEKAEDEKVVFLTNGCCENAHGSRELFAPHGLKGQMTEHGFYPLTKAEERFVAEDAVLLPNGRSALFGYSVLHQGTKWACPIVEFHFDANDPDAAAEARAEAVAYAAHVGPKFADLRGKAMVDEDEKDKVCVNVLVPFEAIMKASLHFPAWKRLFTALALPPGGPRVTARFQPQAWVRDNAIDVDAEGDVEWDVTHVVATMEREDALQLQDDRDNTDSLREDPNAPEWIRNWSGPFWVEVEDSVRDYFDELDRQPK